MTSESIPVPRSDQSQNKWLTGLKEFFILVLAQGRTLRVAYPGIMHFLIFWGMTFLTIGHAITLMQMDLFVPFIELPFPRGGTYLAFETISDIAGLVLLAGLGMAAYRRLVMKPKYLQSTWEDYYPIIMLALIPLLGYVNEGVRLLATAPDWAGASPIGNLTASLMAALGMTQAGAASFHPWIVRIHIIVGLVFVASIPFTKLRHLFITPINILLRDRRKSGVLDKVEDIEEAEILGVGKIDEFKSSQLLAIEACVQCGRCEDNCPVTIAGANYTPRSLINQLKQNLELDLKRTNGNSSNGYHEIFIDETAWACTTCGYCLENCPAYVNPIDEIIDIRRSQVLMTGEIPKSVADTLRNMERQGNPWGIPPEDRMNWAEGLDLREADPEQEVDVLVFLGCSMAFDERNKKIARAMINLLEQNDVDYAILGFDEMCCGETARRLGHEYVFQVMAEENIQLLNEMKFKRIVTGCPHCFNTIKNEYPQLGGNYEVQHFTQLLNELNIQLKRNGQKITYHDPCYLGRYNAEYQAPRSVLNGQQVEMARNRRDSFCCGGGGGQMWLETDAETRVSKVRLQHILDSGADVVATACPYCLTMFEDAISSGGYAEEIQAKDITELLIAESQPEDQKA